MALSADQRALLQLLLERSQSYADLAGLLGSDSGAVRSRAQAAVAELAGGPVDDQASVTDFLLGQGDPIDRADAVRELRRDPETHRLAEQAHGKLRVIAPKAELPELPRAPKAKRSESGRNAAGADDTPRPRFGRRGRLVIAGALAAIMAISITVVVLTTGGGNDSSTASTDTSTTSDLLLPPIELAPTSRAPKDAKGVALVRREGEGITLDVTAQGLPPTKKGQVFTVWLYNNRKFSFPVTRGNPVTSDGQLSGSVSLPQQYIPVLPQIRSVDVSLQREGTTDHSGRSFLRGRIQGGSALPGGAPNQEAPAPDSGAQDGGTPGLTTPGQ
ncbi:MAG: hypothetical protein ACR2NA_14290 [Solirubrobacterales bacterium]